MGEKFTNDKRIVDEIESSTMYVRTIWVSDKIIRQPRRYVITGLYERRIYRNRSTDLLIADQKIFQAVR